jgi:hypothetical protein
MAAERIRQRRIRWALLTAAVIPLVQSCAAATAPSQQHLTITGVAVLTAGLTTQLTAKAPDGTVVTAGLSWASNATGVATVSAAGIVTGVAPGSAVITANSGQESGTSVVAVQPLGTTVQSVSACQSIYAPGQYVVSTDLSSPGSSTCLSLGNLASVQLDCGGHAVGAIAMTGVNNVTVRNCNVTGLISLTDANAVTVANSTVTNGLIFVVRGTNVNITADTVRPDGPVHVDGVLLSGGMFNRVTGSTLIGGYDGGKANVGADDGVLIASESGDVVDGNTIRDFYDLGVEGIDALVGVTVSNNTFSNLGVAGVGSYWCTNWTNNIIGTNQVSAAPALAFVVFQQGTGCSVGTSSSLAGFSGNQFIGNVVRDEAAGTLGGASGPTTPIGPAIYIIMTGMVSGNILQGNDFGTYPGPNVTPLTGFIDGGGNICGPVDPGISNFTCSGGTAAEGLRRRTGEASTRDARRPGAPFNLAQRPAQPFEGPSVVLLLFRQDVAHAAGGPQSLHPPQRPSRQLWWPVSRCRSMARFWVSTEGYAPAGGWLSRRVYARRGRPSHARSPAKIHDHCSCAAIRAWRCL